MRPAWRHGSSCSRAGGVPFFPVSCVQGWQEGTFTAGEEGGGDTLPWSVAHAVRQRVAALPSTAQAVLGVAAVAGREALRRLLVTTSASPEAEVLAALEAACQARLLEEVGVAAYRFPHDVIREVVEAGLGAARRAGLHRDLARVLEQGPDAPPVEALAYHYAQAGEHTHAAQWLERAGDQAVQRGASAAALGHYAAAREHLPPPPDAGAACARLEEKQGDLHRLTGALEQAVAAFARARGQEADPARRAELRRKEGETWMRRGASDRALQTLAAADAEGGTDEGSPLPAGVRAAIELSRANVYVARWEVVAAAAAAERALALLSTEPPGARRDHALALAERTQHSVAFILACSRGRDHDYARAEAFTRQGLARSERLGDREGVAWWWKSRGSIAWRRGQLALAEECLRRGLQVAEEIGQHEWSGQCWEGLGCVAADRQDLDQAEACLQHARTSAQRSGDPAAMAWVWVTLGHLSRERGDLGAAITRLRKAVTVAAPLAAPPGLETPWLSLGWCLWRSGDLTGAEECLRREIMAREGTVWTDYLTRAYLGLGGVLRDRGDRSAAHYWLRRARRGAQRAGILALEVEATVEQGRNHLLAGQYRAAGAALARAQRLIHAEDAGAAAGHVQLLAAELHVQEGRLEAAQTAAAVALECATADEARRGQRLWVAASSEGRPLQSLAQRCLGVCARRQGAHAAALAHLRAALAVQLELSAALEAARTRLALAETLVATARPADAPPEARMLLAEAQAQFASSRATRDVALADQMTRAWGLR